jgi:hypothetical protein
MPLQHMLFRHLLGEIDEHYGGLILHTEVCWLNTINFHSGFNCIFQKSRILQARSGSPSILKDYWWLLDLTFLTVLTAKQN